MGTPEAGSHPQDWRVGWIVWALHRTLVAYAAATGRPARGLSVGDVFIGGADDVIQCRFMVGGRLCAPTLALHGVPGYDRRNFVQPWRQFAEWLATATNEEEVAGLAPYLPLCERLVATLMILPEAETGLCVRWSDVAGLLAN